MYMYLDGGGGGGGRGIWEGWGSDMNQYQNIHVHLQYHVVLSHFHFICHSVIKTL